jgi:hypothetical protein
LKVKMKRTENKLFRIAALFGFSLACGSNALADGNPSDYLHTRTYIGAVGTSVSVGNGGIFNGQNYSALTSPSYEIDLIPSISQNFGFGLLIGHREEAYALEVSYWQSNHIASFGPAAVTSPSVTTPTNIPLAQDTAVYNSINLDFKRYFLTELQLQPFVNLGVSFPWIVVQNAAEDGNGNIGSVSLAGLGLNLGVGVEYYITPNISVMGGGYERWASFDQSKGSISASAQYNRLSVNGSAGSDDGSGLIFMVGTTIGFQ